MYPELEILFTRRDGYVFQSTFRLRQPQNTVLPAPREARVELDAALFDDVQLRGDPVAYGLRLGQNLLADAVARTAFTDATAAAAQTQSQTLRVRICCDPSAHTLLNLRWELLRVPDVATPDDPTRARWLALDQRVYFSRHIYSHDLREVRLRARSDLTALIAVASPTNVGNYADSNRRPLQPLDLENELAIAREGLQGLSQKPAELVPTPNGPRMTLQALTEALQKEPDILYLVCHGAVTASDESHVLLEQPDGSADIVTGDRLIKAFQPLRTLPRLVVLISCQSAGNANTNPNLANKSVLAAIGPKLAEAGVASVLAMQGDLDQRTARAFLPAFFQKLNETGQVDEAVCVGRLAVQAANAPGPWVPVLYTRLVDGRVWFTKGLRSTVQGQQVSWDQICQDINNGRCLPILGSGVLEPFLGTTRDIAKALARQRGYPMSISGREDLPQVAQYLFAMRTGTDTTVSMQVTREMAEAVGRRFPHLTFPAIRSADPGGSLQDRLELAWSDYCQTHPYEPHQFLAQLKTIKTYVTTNPDQLLAKALQQVSPEQPRKPTVYHLDWTDVLEGVMQDTQEEENRPLKPTPERPHLFHLMGNLRDLDTLVLTEDHYFQFLTANARRANQTRNHNLEADQAVGSLNAALAISALVFLGFRVTDWDFRTLCRLLADQAGRNGKKNRTHIAVQIDPEHGTHEDAVEAREYIAKLFDVLIGRPNECLVAVYWGSAEDFLEELHTNWMRSMGQTIAQGVGS